MEPEEGLDSDQGGDRARVGAARPRPCSIMDTRARGWESEADDDGVGGPVVQAAQVAVGDQRRDDGQQQQRAHQAPEQPDRPAVQARDPDEGALGRVLGLTAHSAFEAKNPNRLRALVSTFASFNPVRFHDPSGAGYRFLADQILATDGFNPMTAARLVEPLGGWRRYKPELGQLMKAELQRILEAPGLSKNVFELVSRALAEE